MSDSAVPLLGLIFFTIFFLVPLVLWIWALIDIIRFEFTDNNKVIWLLVVFFVPLIGTILYFIIGRKQRLTGNLTGGAAGGFCTGCGTATNGAIICPTCRTPQRVAAKGNNGAIIAIVAVVFVFVFIAVIGILAAIAIPQFASYRMKGYNAMAKSEIQQAKTAVEIYYSSNNAYPDSLDKTDYRQPQQPQMVLELQKLEDGSYLLTSYHKQGTKVFATSSQTPDILAKAKEAPDTDYAVETVPNNIQQQ